MLALGIWRRCASEPLSEVYSAKVGVVVRVMSFGLPETGMRRTTVLVRVRFLGLKDFFLGLVRREGWSRGGGFESFLCG